MSLRVKLSAFAAALVLSASALAQDDTCPNINDLQAEKIRMSQQIGEHYYIGYSIAHFNTSSTWSFAIGPVEADSSRNALNSSNEILSTMFTSGTPMELGGQLVCLYDTGNPYIYSIAIREGSINSMALKQYLLRNYK